RPPAAVMEATKDYFSDQDTLMQWLEECTKDGGPFAFIKSSELYASWRNWCEERGIEPGSGKALAEELENHGLEKTRAHGGVRGFKKLALRDDGTWQR